MLLDVQQFDSDTELECDIAIVGAGAAGIALARQLSGRGRGICLLESGGLDFEAGTQALAAGENLGQTYYPLVDSRLRFFGGTTAIWGGRCSRYDPIDFETRSWVPHSGWPLDSADLEAHYAAAAEDFGLTPRAADAAGWKDDSAQRFQFDSDLFATRCWHFDERKERFGAAASRDVLSAADVRVCLHANVTRICAAPNAAAVSGIEAAALNGRGLRVRARKVVLAAGGIENARLMLASNDVESCGLGNARDQVGRYFMEHPHGRAGVLETGAGFELWAAFQRRQSADGARTAPVLLPTPGLQARAGILNTALTFKLQPWPPRELPVHKRIVHGLREQLAPTRAKRRLWHTYRDARKLVQRTIRRPIQRRRFAAGRTRVNVMVRGEQAPNPDSRVTLTEARDALGMPRAALDWQMSELDKHTVRVLARTLDGECKRLGLGSLEPAAWLDTPEAAWPVDATVGNHPIGGYHHLGTTRMSESPADGVVDRDCRVHGYGNLFVAGSSVFPTAGWANPTLTIIALARRLADKLLEESE